MERGALGLVKYYILTVVTSNSRERAYVYYKAGLAGQWPFLRVFSAIGRRMAQQRWPMAEIADWREDPRLFTV